MAWVMMVRGGGRRASPTGEGDPGGAGSTGEGRGKEPTGEGRGPGKEG